MTAPKQYGLIISKKKTALQSSSTTRPSIFGDDADEEQQETSATGTKKPSAFSSRIKTQTQIQIEKALAEDPTVYEYDEIYDDIEKKRAEANPKVKDNKDRKPRYIAGLLKAAEERQREWERRQERLVHKEREKEGDLYKDKEAFVTDSFRKKMIELQKLEEEEKKKEEYEAVMDVTKQDGLGGFYRFMYQTKTGVVHVKEEGETDEAPAISAPVKEEDAADVSPPRPQQSSDSNSRSQSPTSSRRRRSRSRSSSGSRSNNKRRSRSRSETRSKSSRDPARPAATEKPSKPKKGAEEEAEKEKLKAMLGKRTDDDTASDARARYLARKQAMAEAKGYIEKEEEK